MPRLEGEKSNSGVWIVALALLIAVAAVLYYVFARPTAETAPPPPPTGLVMPPLDNKVTPVPDETPAADATPMADDATPMADETPMADNGIGATENAAPDALSTASPGDTPPAPPR